MCNHIITIHNAFQKACAISSEAVMTLFASYNVFSAIWEVMKAECYKFWNPNCKFWKSRRRTLSVHNVNFWENARNFASCFPVILLYFRSSAVNKGFFVYFRGKIHLRYTELTNLQFNQTNVKIGGSRVRAWGNTPRTLIFVRAIFGLYPRQSLTSAVGGGDSGVWDSLSNGRSRCQ